MTVQTAPHDAVRDAAPARRPWLTPGLLLAVAVTATLVAFGLDVTHGPADLPGDLGWGSATAIVGLLPVACAGAILARHPRHAVGWVMAVTGLIWALDGLAESYAARAVASSPDLPLAGFAVWFVAQFGSVLLVGLPLLLLLYPSGSFVPGRWQRISRLAVAMAFALPVTLMLAPEAVVARDGAMPVATGMPALPVPDDVYAVVLGVARLATLLSLPLAVAVVVARLRRSSGLERHRLQWLAWAAIMCVLFTAIALFLPSGVVTTTAIAVCLALTSVSVAIGILDPGLTDVDALMGGTLVYSAVAAVVVAFDLVALAVLNAVLGDRLDERRATLVVLLVAVAAYGPLRAWLGGLTRRALVGRRGDRYGVVAGLAARLEESGDVRVQLPALAADVATTFKLGFVRVEVFGHAGGTLSAAHGTEPPSTREVPIRYGGEDVGRLFLPAQGLRSMLSRRDQELLLDVVRQAAMAVRGARLADDLQASREQLVLAREEDRKRIRRDLHDGLGPVLGGVAMRLDAVGNAMATDPDSARRLVSQSRDDITEALADVRRLVHGLRPPALDDLGLRDALHQQVERTRPPGLTVELEAEGLPPLPAAVEVAAYRIASEALTNSIRHAGATGCRLRLVGSAREVLVEVVDDGRGIDPEVPAGVGLHSIRERAAELGGRVEVTCPPEGGTRVSAWLPLTKETA